MILLSDSACFLSSSQNGQERGNPLLRMGIRTPIYCEKSFNSYEKE